MFGKEKSKKKAVGDWTFDLENDLKDGAKMRKTKEHVNDRVQLLKTMLREGDDKKTFDEAQTLLHGFLAVQKVIQRVVR